MAEYVGTSDDLHQAILTLDFGLRYVSAMFVPELTQKKTACLGFGLA
jgi:hypothetical protein